MVDHDTWGYAPCWYTNAPSALKTPPPQSANGAPLNQPGAQPQDSNDAKGRGLKARPIPCLATLACLALLAATSHAQQLHIRIFNATTNKPITDEQLNVALRADQIGSVAMPTDKFGVITVDTHGATTIRILGNMYADCRPRGELYTDYPIATILKTGITTGNLCSNIHLPPKPGELLLFEKPKTYIPVMPNPPANSLPHSDEQPPTR